VGQNISDDTDVTITACTESSECMTDEPDVRRALVIEDDEDIRGLLVHILTKQVSRSPPPQRGWPALN
jgi:hypothetical protein